MIVFMATHDPHVVTINNVHHLVKRHHPIGGCTTWCGLWANTHEEGARGPRHLCRRCQEAINDHRNGWPGL